MNLKNETGAAMAASRSAYEAKVGVEAVLRSGGKNPQLNGVVHEILYRDALTMKPGNLANGVRGTLSKSVTAVRDDVLLKQGGAVVITEDECSAEKIYSVLRDCANDSAKLGKMARAMLEMGRPEAVENITETLLGLAGK